MQITSVMKQTQQEILPKRVMGIEPTCSAWKADILPLNYTRIYLVFSAVLRRLYYYTTSQNKCQYFFLKKIKKIFIVPQTAYLPGLHCKKQQASGFYPNACEFLFFNLYCNFLTVLTDCYMKMLYYFIRVINNL